ncbi:RluA family pseudouridine synthase [Ruoffia halotolerans]|nr:RluA family pseudouridine synthase [Ruoffia halotolerans]
MKIQKNNPNMIYYTAKEPTELLKFMLEQLAPKSRNAIKSMLTRGQFFIDGKAVTQHNHPLKKGDQVGMLSNKSFKKIETLEGLRILHEDDDIIVIDKDAGILSVAGKDHGEATAYRQLMHYVKADNRNNRIFVVHRLDRDTSGVMVYAKSESIKDKLQENWQTLVKERIYTALVEGSVRRDKGRIESWLTESKTMKVYSSRYDNGGKHAVTHYTKKQGNVNYSLLEVQLETGRKNQIRVHMEEIGHPVAGDKKYGAKTNPLKRLGLHATTIAFEHPRTGKVVKFSSPAPKGFLKVSR